ncbi:unnamed protein product [Linum trigynum]|uniref:DUF4283 domain-containing protein n=1 Tax=Linum trigynum TaxID=586398 RepID=A0AAV2DUE9_9ROSI
MENQTGDALANQYKEWDDEDLAVIFTDEVLECQGGSRLRLVGKLFSEREINKKSISGMINGAWSHFCEPVVRDLLRSRNLFIFVFDTPEEKEKAWAGRPWQVSGCMLQLKQYEEKIRPRSSILTWRISGSMFMGFQIIEEPSTILNLQWLCSNQSTPLT